MTVVPAKIVLPYIIGSFTIAYFAYELTINRRIFGGTVPRTMTKEWKDETLKKFDEGWPRVAGPPVVLNPQRRSNFKVISNKEE